MLRKITQKIKYRIRKRYESGRESKSEKKFFKEIVEDNGKKRNISKNINDNYRSIQNEFCGSDDLKFREFLINSETGKRRKAFIVFIDGLVSGKVINESIVGPLISGIPGQTEFNEAESNNAPIDNSMISVGEIREIFTIEDAILGCLDGDTVLFADGMSSALIIGSKGYEKRSITNPEDEVNVRGPKDSFVENLRDNTAMIRRRVKNNNLVFETIRLGEQTKTPVAVAYIDGIAEKTLIREVKRRLKGIDIDGILDSGYIAQLIDDAPFSIFETVGYTERPDVASAKLLEGRIVIIVDGSPFALTLPYLFIEAFQTPSDYYSKPAYSFFIRAFRIFAFIITIMAPAIYVAITTFHQEFLPSKLLITIAKAREGIPFSAFAEALVMLLIFEILKEAGLRLPKSIGQTISIVGALVMGDAAVSAGIASAPLVITIAFAAVAGFVVSFLNDQVFILRIFFLVLAGLFGGYGIVFGFILLTINMVSLKSFGRFYMTPMMPLIWEDLKDGAVRAPLWVMRTRPVGFATENPIRENNPIPPESEE
ncbi:MAG: spore germination protein [Ruminococcaceae bacterium]|nr:spore germination protein [Oscillospiraceae bacterium]